MQLSDKNLIVNLSQEYEDIKIIMGADETHFFLKKFYKENDIKVNINDFLTFVNELYLKPKENLSKEKIVLNIREKLNMMVDCGKNKSEKKRIVIDIFTFLFQFKDLMFNSVKFKKTVFLKSKELFEDFDDDERNIIIYLYLSLFHIVLIKKNLLTFGKISYKINEKNQNNSQEDSIDYYFDNY